MFLSKEIDEKLIMAFELYNQKLCESLPTDAELKDITFSETFEKNMQKLIFMQKKSYYYMINTVGKRVAIIVLAIIISLTATTFSVKALREAVVEFITKTFERFTTVTVETQEPEVEIKVVKTVPQYIPDGYIVESDLDLGGIYKITYNNKDNIPISYNQRYSYGTIYNVNTEDIEYEKIMIGTLEGIMYVRNETHTVVFADEIYLYTVSGQVSFDELIKMAESIKTE